MPSIQKIGDEHIKLGKGSAVTWVGYHQCPLCSNTELETRELCSRLVPVKLSTFVTALFFSGALYDSSTKENMSVASETPRF